MTTIPLNNMPRERLSHAFSGPSILLALVALFLFGITRQRAAADPTTAPSTAPTKVAAGTWVYVMHIEDLDVNATANLTQTDTTITGTVKAGEDKNGLDITDGKINGNDISFTVDRVMEQGTLESKYNGTIDGDKIGGKIEVLWVNRDNSTTNIDWNATRKKEN
jgi:FlaG/FlaF family flagellin (archaellin)